MTFTASAHIPLQHSHTNTGFESHTTLSASASNKPSKFLGTPYIRPNGVTVYVPKTSDSNPFKNMAGSDIFLFVLALFLPPLAVFLKRQCTGDFWLNLILSFFGWLPGVIHAWYVISKYDDRPVMLVEERAPIGSAPNPMSMTAASAPVPNNNVNTDGLNNSYCSTSAPPMQAQTHMGEPVSANGPKY